MYQITTEALLRWLVVWHKRKTLTNKKYEFNYQAVNNVMHKKLYRRLCQLRDKSRYVIRRRQNSLMTRMNMEHLLLKNRSGKRIVSYHGIDLCNNTQYNSRFIGRDIFEQQIAYYASHFNVVSLDDYYRLPGDSEKLTLAITFDDGYLNNLKYALPILEKYQIPASFFITGIMDTGEKMLWADLLDLVTFYYNNEINIEGETFSKNRGMHYVSRETGKSLKQVCKDSGWQFKKLLMHKLKQCISDEKLDELDVYWRQMDQQDIQELACCPLVTIGSHGYYHNNLSSISHEQAVDEIKRSKGFLENLVQKPIDAIAFPCGSYTTEILKSCDELGITKQLAVEYLYKDDMKNQHIVDRIGNNPFIGFTDQISSILKGSYY